MSAGHEIPAGSVPTDAPGGFCARVIDYSGGDERFEERLEAAGRLRQLSM